LKPTNRTISCFLQGLINIVADLVCGKGVSLDGLFPHALDDARLAAAVAGEVISNAQRESSSAEPGGGIENSSACWRRSVERR